MTTYSLNGCGKQVRFVHEGAKEKLELNLSNTSMNSILITKFPQSKKLKKKKKNLKINFLIISVENHLIVFDIKKRINLPENEPAFLLFIYLDSRYGTPNAGVEEEEPEEEVDSPYFIVIFFFIIIRII